MLQYDRKVSICTQLQNNLNNSEFMLLLLSPSH